MRKHLFFVLALTIALPGFAQSDDEEEYFPPSKEKSNAFFVGPKIGGALTTMSQPNEGQLYDASAFGFTGGLAIKSRFGQATENSVGGTGYFGIGVELKYLQNTVKTLGTDDSGNENANLSVNYFNVPIYAQIYPFAKVPNLNTFYVELGLAFVGTLSRSPESLTLKNPSSEYSWVTYNFDTENSTLKGMDVRPLGGIGYTIPNSGLDINARYYLGTSSLAGNFPCKFNTLEISVAWFFNAGKF